jgi:hypothetical protein
VCDCCCSVNVLYLHASPVSQVLLQSLHGYLTKLITPPSYYHVDATSFTPDIITLLATYLASSPGGLLCWKGLFCGLQSMGWVCGVCAAVGLLTPTGVLTIVMLLVVPVSGCTLVC